MNEIYFFIPLRKIPSVTAQEQRTGTKKDGTTYRYDPQKLKAVKALFRDHLAQHAPPKPFTGPVFLEVLLEGRRPGMPGNQRKGLQQDIQRRRRHS